jgi:NADH dehydrogenase
VKIAVTGATGFVGGHLVSKLLDAGHDVIAVRHRKPLESDSAVSGRLETRQGSVHDQESLVQAFAGAEVVMHLVGIIVETETNTFERTVSRGTEYVVHAAKEAGVRHIVYLSAMGTASGAKTAYHRSKYDAEQTVQTSGLSWNIWRPSMIHGPGDGFVTMLRSMIRKAPVVPVIGDGRYRLQPVLIDDVVDVMTRGLITDSTHGEIFEIGGPEKLEYRQILDIIMRVTGNRRLTVPVPVFVARMGAALAETILTPAPITRDQIAMLVGGNTGDNGLLQEKMEFRPVGFEAGLRRYVR